MPDFRLVDGDLRTIARTDYTLTIRTVGPWCPRGSTCRPETVVRMERNGDGAWEHTFRAVRETMDLVVSAHGTPALDLVLTVLPRPELQDLKVSVRPPAHTGLPPFEQRNEGDLDVPEGNLLSFNGTRHADRLGLRWGEQEDLEPDVDNRFSFTRTAQEDLSYTFHPQSTDVRDEDSVRYRLRTIADRRPTIRVVELPDSLTLNRIAFNGLVQDDYGFTSLRFVYRMKGADRESLDLDRPSGREDGFIHLWDLSEAGIGLGDEVEYWFEIRDNDGVNGPKMTQSRTFVHQVKKDSRNNWTVLTRNLRRR